MPTTLPELFGRYRIQKKLGEGGMGAVYLAEDTKLRRKVALKVPHFTGTESSSILQRFEREARMAAQIEHPNLCPIHDVDVIDGIHYITMAYIEGQPLSKLIGPEKKWQIGDALLLIRQIALALAHLHEAGIIHRDLKPANVMIRKDGNPVIMDFGLARSFQDASQQLTGTQHPLGTPAYMSPEQVMADPNTIGPRSDLYSLGVILYELLGGRLPFTGSVVQVFANILHTQPPLLGQLRPDVPPAVEALVMQTMAKNPADRPESMKVFADRLGAMISQIGTQPDGTLVPSRGSGTHSALTIGQSHPGGADLRQTPPGSWAAPTPPAWSTPGAVPPAPPQPGPVPPSWGVPPGTPTPWPTAPTHPVSQAPVYPGSSGQMPAYGPPATPPGSMPGTGWPAQSGGSWQPAGVPPSVPAWHPTSSATHPVAPGQAGKGHGLLLASAVVIFLICLGVSAWFVYVIVTNRGAAQASGSGPGGVASVTPTGDVTPTGPTHGGGTTEPTGRTGPTGPTRREVPPPVVALGLKLATTELKVEAGKSDRVGIEITRDGFEQEVQITLVASSSGVTAEPLRLRPGQNKGDLTIQVGGTATQGAQKLTVKASAEVDGKPITQSAPLTVTVTAPPVVAGQPFTNKVGMKLVPIKAGKFVMGSDEKEPGGQEGERPAREVTISKPFYMGAHEVTQKQFESVMGKNKNPSWFSPERGGKEQLPVGLRDTSDFPADSVPYDDALEFCKKLSELPEEKAHGRVYRLPTEAEWEYACRAGTTTPYNVGDELMRQKDANIEANPNTGSTVAVGSYKPNAWGLYDMHGNVAEWCSDWWSDSYYFQAKKNKLNVDPQGPEKGEEPNWRVLRGGAYLSDAQYCRSANRDGERPSTRPSRKCGFRVVCVVAE